jgi:hypothetical protein
METLTLHPRIVPAKKAVRLNRSIEDVALELVKKGFSSLEITRALTHKFGVSAIRAERVFQEAALNSRLLG